MKIAIRNCKLLGIMITGDTKQSPYMKGSELVDFYNEFGSDDVYEQGFPSRWVY